MERFAIIVNDISSLIIVAKRSILDVWQGSECASAFYVMLKKGTIGYVYREGMTVLVESETGID